MQTAVECSAYHVAWPGAVAFIMFCLCLASVAWAISWATTRK